MPPNVSSITEEPNLVTKPYKPDIFVVTNAPYNAPHNEVDFQKFNSPCEQDASAAIQQLLMTPKQTAEVLYSVHPADIH